MTSRLFMIAAFSALAGAASAQDLAAAAQQEKERREKNREAGVKVRVITPKEVRTVPPGPPPSAKGAVRDRPRGGVAPAVEVSDPLPDDTAILKARGASMKPQLRAAERAVLDAQAGVVKAQQQIELLNRTSYINGDARAAARRDLEHAQKSLQSAKEYRDSIEDSARRQGIPPGYLR